MADTETPRTAVDVLREHYAVDRQPFGRPLYRQCTCGWSEDVNRRGFPQHQADVLAAAGLLAEGIEAIGGVVVMPGREKQFAEWIDQHDREVAAEAFDEGVRAAAEAIFGPSNNPRHVQRIVWNVPKNPHRTAEEEP